MILVSFVFYMFVACAWCGRVRLPSSRFPPHLLDLDHDGDWGKQATPAVSPDSWPSANPTGRAPDDVQTVQRIHDSLSVRELALGGGADSSTRPRVRVWCVET